MDERLTLGRAFLERAGWGGANVTPLAGDASARRYFRVRREGGDSAVLMDAPAIDGQDVAPFVAVGSFLRGQSLSAPEILAADQEAGFLLLEDLGDALFARVIDADPHAELTLYAAAVDVLISLDQTPVPGFVPLFDANVMAGQVAPFFEWYLRADSNSAQAQFQAELETVLRRYWAGPGALLLRDFHAENLIWLPARSGLARVGLLDFQDAMAGPPAYDLVSLLLDARRDVSPEVIQTMIARFADGTGRTLEGVETLFSVIGAQRNLRILGVFARLARLYGKPRYLDFVPRVWGHVRLCLAHPSLAGLAGMIEGDLTIPTKAFLRGLKDG